MFEPLLSPLFSSLLSPLIAQPIPITRMDLISNLILQRGAGVATFTRSTTGTFDAVSTGLVTTAAIDEARFEANGVLIEGESTNEALHNRDFTDVAHVKTNITALKDAVGADGVNNASSTLTATAANGTVFQTVTKASAENTYSIDIRRKTGTGTIEISDDGGAGFTDITSSINSSTYTRFQITSTQANPEFGVRIVTSGDEIEVDYEQLEELPFASSRIETTTTSVTRAADNLSIDAANIPPSAADYSVSCVFDVIGISGSAQALFKVEGENARTGSAVTNTKATFQHVVVSKTTTSIISNTTFKFTGTVDDINVTLFLNGSQEDQDSKNQVGGTKQFIRIGNLNASGFLFGHIKSFKIFDVRLTPNQVPNV